MVCSMGEPIEDRRQMNEAEEGHGEFVVTGADATTAFDVAEEVFDAVSAPVVTAPPSDAAPAGSDVTAADSDAAFPASDATAADAAAAAPDKDAVVPDSNAVVPDRDAAAPDSDAVLPDCINRIPKTRQNVSPLLRPQSSVSCPLFSVPPEAGKPPAPPNPPRPRFVSCKGPKPTPASGSKAKSWGNSQN